MLGLCCEEPAGNVAGEQVADLDAYRQTMALRKNRADQFLQDEESTFSLLSMLTLNLLLQRVTRVAFKLTNADKDGLGFPRKAEKRRRISRKGPAGHASDADAAVGGHENGPRTAADLLIAARSVIRDLWKLLDTDVHESVWCVAVAYWPASQPVSSMLMTLAADMLKTLAALKFRITMRFEVPPLFFWGQRFLGDNVEDEGELDPNVQHFLRTSPCCLDPWWGRVVQKDVAAEPHDPSGLLADHVSCFTKHARLVSVREETMHALQRKVAGGFAAKPRSFDRQAASVVLATASDHFMARGGRNLNSAHTTVKTAMTVIRKKKVTHARPRQFGNGMFAFVGEMLKQNPGSTQEHWRQVWKELPAQEREGWKARQRFKVASKRQRQALQATKEREQTVLSTPWALGDDRFPLTTNWVEELLRPFQARQTGREELAKLGTEEATRFLDGATSYHSADAAVIRCKEHLGALIDDQSAAKGSWALAETCPPTKDSCFDLHPGLCCKEDVAVLKLMPSFMSHIPKRSTVLRFERCGCSANQKVVIFVRAVLGRTSASQRRLPGPGSSRVQMGPGFIVPKRFGAFLP